MYSGPQHHQHHYNYPSPTEPTHVALRMSPEKCYSPQRLSDPDHHNTQQSQNTSTLPPLLLTLLFVCDFSEVLRNSNHREAIKRSIIKINKKKLPSDFFSSDYKKITIDPKDQENDPLQKNPSNPRTTLRSHYRNHTPLATDRQVCSEQDFGNPSKYDPQPRQRVSSIDKYPDRPQHLDMNKIRNAAFFGLAITESLSARKQRDDSRSKQQQQQQTPPLDFNELRQRNYYTRSSEKRQKAAILLQPPRKLTAIPNSTSNRHSQGASELFPSNSKPGGEDDNMIIFTGTFAKDSFATGNSPTKPILNLSPNRPSPTKERLERRIDYQSLKLDTLRIRMNFADIGSAQSPTTRKDSSTNSSGLMTNNSNVSTSNSNTAQELLSPGRKEGMFGSVKKQIMSPVKIIVSSSNRAANESTRKMDNSQNNSLSSSTGNQAMFDVTFFNSGPSSSSNKSSMLPPINSNNSRT